MGKKRKEPESVSIAENQDATLSGNNDFCNVTLAELKEKLSASFQAATTTSLLVLQDQHSPDSRAFSDSMDLKVSKTPCNDCSHPIINSADVLASDDKSHSSSDDFKITYKKRNKAASGKDEASSFVCIVTQDTQVPGEKNFTDSSLIETTDVVAPSKNDAEASTSDNLILVTNNDSSLRTADGDIAQTSGMVHYDGSSFNILKDNSSKHVKKYKRRGKDEYSGTNSASSLSGISEMISVLKGSNEVSLSSTQVSSAAAANAVPNFCAESKTENMPQINSVPSIVRTTRHQTNENATENSQSVDTLKKDVTSNIDIEDSDSKALPNKTNLSPEMPSNSFQLEVISSIQDEKSGEQERSLSGIACDSLQTCTDATSTLQLVVSSVDGNGSSRVPASDEFRSITELKCDINEAAASNSALVQKTESGLDNSGEGRHAVAVEGSLKLPAAGLKEGASVPPSPIRGLVEELCSPSLPMKQHNHLDSCNEECASFSFQIENKVPGDNSSINHSGEASKLGIRDGSESVKPATNSNNAFDCKCKHTGSSTSQEKEHASSSISHVVEDVSSTMTKDRDESSDLAALSTTETLLSCSRKKLIVLDLNGLLADINQDYRNAHKAHKRVAGKFVFKRPFCDDFLKFCFERFHVGVWSSRKRYNVDAVVDCLMGNLKHKLLFCWDQSKCTETGQKTIDNVYKPLFLKELKKLWNKEERDLPWEKGEYSPCNTLLVDDSPYKAICNPPHTAIFPHPYIFTDENDNSLGPEGDLRVYLAGLAMADDVQLYVREHPFGQNAIAESDSSWNFYLQIIDEIQKSSSLNTRKV